MNGEGSTPTTSAPSEEDEMKTIDHKGGKAVLYKNYHYHRLRDYKNGQTILRCSSYRKTKCKGTITVKAHKVLKTTDHSCPKNENHIMILAEKDKLKKAVICSDRPIPQLYEEAILQMKRDGHKKEIIDSISLSSIKHGLYDARYKSVGTTKSIFNNIHEVDVPKKYLHFLLADFHDDQTRILVFCSPGNKEHIKHVTEFFIDGTFSSCPDPFTQLVSIHGDMGSTLESIYVKPFIFAFMSDKKQRSYTYLFNIVKSQIPKLNIEKLHCDFEIGMINAIREVWPTVTIKGCYYHWTKMIWRNAKKNNCKKTKHERRIGGLCSVLPLIGEQKITEGWHYIKSEYENAKLAMQPFMTYVDNTLKKKDFIKIIGVLGERHRTNNVLEGWHSKLNKSINKNTKTLLRLLKVLADMDEITIDKTANRRRKKKESLESVYSSSSRLNLLNKRKRMNALTGDMSSYHNLSGKGDRYVTQRVLSAKTHRVKQLQNQLADAHYHLQEISNENRVLRALQKKQEIALQRYENSNAELPQVLNSHSEEMRIQQTKYKQLKMQFKELSQKAKEKDIQLQTLKDEHQHLVELSKDRNLPEREKLQAQVAELTQKVQMQAETINMLQRRISLEAKNFKHQLQVEINKHKDTRHDLDLAITNADKLSTIIEMKEKMLSTAASRSLRSPNKSSSVANINRVVKSAKYLEGGGDRNLDRNIDNSALGRLCQDSRQISSSFSHDDDLTTTMTAEPSSRSRYSRSNSRAQSTSSRTTPNQTRKSSKGSDEMLELSRTVQEGMADLNLYDEDSEIFLKNNTSEDVQKKVEAMKADLVNKIIKNEDPLCTQSFRMRKMSTDSKEDLKLNEEPERPKSRGRRNSSVSFFGNEASEEIKTLTFIESNTEIKTITPKRESSNLEAKLSGKPIDKYCKDIIHDIERSSKVIERHVKSFASSRFDNDKIVQQLQAVDELNHYVNAQGEVPDEALNELNNNFKMLTDQVLPESSSARKRSVSGRRSSRMESRTNLLGDNCISNQDLLEDLLGKK